VLAAADERKTPADAIAPGYPHSLPCRRCSSAGGDQNVGIHRSCDVLIQKGCDVAAVATDHGAPADRTVGHSQCLDDAKLRQWVQLRTAPDARHRHTEHACVLHRLRNGRWNPPTALDLVARRPDLFGQPDCRMQNRRIVCCCSTRGMSLPDCPFPLGCDNGRLQCWG